MKRIATLLLLCLAAVHGAAKVYDLRCEGLQGPLGIDTTTPHFSWKHTLDRTGQGQTAYELQVGTSAEALARGRADLWDSGKVLGADQVMVAYEGKPLAERQLCFWRLRTWDERGRASEWTQPERFAVGILGGMAGEYIGCDAPVSRLRTTIHVEEGQQGPVFAHVNSLGYHELFVEGRRVGDEVLQPAVSQLDRHSLIVTYDLTPYLEEGDNELTVWIGQGWYRPTTFKGAANAPLLKAEVCQLRDGAWQTLAKTDASWQASATGYGYAGTWWPLQFGGEHIDASFAGEWQQARVYPVSGMRATPQLFGGNRITDRLKPQATTRQPDGSLVVDFGRVVTGWFSAEFKHLPKGLAVTMEYADHIPPGGAFESQSESDTYIAAGQAPELFSNRFHHHAFRYVRIAGATPSQVEALQISALPKEGDVSTFACSDSSLNAIHDMIHYTMQCLTFSGYMVDCPHLERTGYGGDGNSSTMALQTMYDVAPTYMNWLSAWADNVGPDGSLPHVAPAGGGGGGPYWCGFIVKAPWRTFLNYGDRRPLERHYEQMKKWMEYVDRYTVDGLLQPWPDTDNRMWFLGDWLAPNGVDVGGESVIHANNCFISDCLGTMAAIAHLLGHPDEATLYAQKKQERNAAIHQRFFHGTHYANGTPLDQCYAMLAGVPATQEEYDQVRQQFLADCIGKYGTHIAAGLFGVPIFTEWMTRERQADLMAAILRQPDYPGYLHMIANGATTTWEYWSGERSRVHNCYNGIGTWFYQALAGILPDPDAPGYRHFLVSPQPAQGVSSVQASKPTPYGPIEIRWTRPTDDQPIAIDLTVPVGTTATVALPAPESATIYNGKRQAPKAKGTTYLGYQDGSHLLALTAGRHTLTAR